MCAVVRRGRSMLQQQQRVSPSQLFTCLGTSAPAWLFAARQIDAQAGAGGGYAEVPGPWHAWLMSFVNDNTQVASRRCGHTQVLRCLK